MKKRKRIKTKKYEARILIDVILIIICLLFSIIVWKSFLLISFWKVFWNMLLIMFTQFKDFPPLASILSLLLLLLCEFIVYVIVFLIFTFPANIICLAIRRAYFSRLKENTTYQNHLDITYFREAFNNISPSELSVIIDYKTEAKKDITANIMKLYMKKFIDFQNNEIIVLNNNSASLKKSEAYILNELIQKKDFHSISNYELQQISLEEAIKDGYIENKKSKSNLKKKLLILFILFITCLGLKNNLNINTLINIMNEKEDLILAKYEENQNEIEILEDPLLLECCNAILLCLGYGISALGIILIPIYTGIYAISYKNNIPKYRRTNQGNYITELTDGIKHFIQDFSSLEEKEKEEIILWNDFLVLAIVLEENEQIITDIMNHKNVSFKIYK